MLSVGTTRRHRYPLLIPRGYEFISMVSEHRDNLWAIKKEVASFMHQLVDHIQGRHQWNVLLRT